MPENDSPAIPLPHPWRLFVESDKTPEKRGTPPHDTPVLVYHPGWIDKANPFGVRLGVYNRTWNEFEYVDWNRATNKWEGLPALGASQFPRCWAPFPSTEGLPGYKHSYAKECR